MDIADGNFLGMIGINVWVFTGLSVAALGAAFIAAIVGTAGGLILIAVMAFVFPPALLIPLHTVVQLGAATSMAISRWRYLMSDMVLPFTVGTAIGAAIGGRIFVSLPENVLLLALGISILALAKKQGIAKVVKISTYYMYPTTTRGISVQGAEVIKGRQVTYQVLNINGKKWSHHGAGPRHGDIQLGGFWAGKPYARKQTILRVGEIDYRCNSVNGISIKEAENLLALFLEGKFGTEPNVNLRALEHVNWKKPGRLGKRGDSISVSFPHEKAGEGWFDMEVKLDGKQLTITQMLQAIP